MADPHAVSAGRFAVRIDGGHEQKPCWIRWIGIAFVGLSVIQQPLPLRRLRRIAPQPTATLPPLAHQHATLRIAVDAASRIHTRKSDIHKRFSVLRHKHAFACFDVKTSGLCRISGDLVRPGNTRDLRPRFAAIDCGHQTSFECHPSHTSGFRMNIDTRKLLAIVPSCWRQSAFLPFQRRPSPSPVGTALDAIAGTKMPRRNVNPSILAEPDRLPAEPRMRLSHCEPPAFQTVITDPAARGIHGQRNGLP